VWAEVMSYLHRTKSSHPKPPPGDVIHQTVELTNASGKPLEAPHQEWFIQGTEQTLFTLNRTDLQLVEASQPNARIVMPTQGTILALDPDIPSSAQHVTLKAEQFGAQHLLRWTINDKVLSDGSSTTWQPRPGRHKIALIDSNGVTLDRINIEVRGAVGTP